MSNKHPKQVAETKYLNPIAEYLPIEKIANGIIYTRDHRYVKIVEVIPINFINPIFLYPRRAIRRRLQRVG